MKEYYTAGELSQVYGIGKIAAAKVVATFGKKCQSPTGDGLRLINKSTADELNRIGALTKVDQTYSQKFVTRRLPEC